MHLMTTVLMSRLANNESLFHHREVPPADNHYSRIILLDTTLKNWGTIKTISFATMLAIANHPKNKNPIQGISGGKIIPGDCHRFYRRHH